ncbi:MAG: MG2 domain-containing protein [Nonlabens sp.]
MQKALLFFCSFLFLIACNDKTEQEKKEEQKNEFFKFREHIAEVTSDEISVAEPIIIKLTTPVEGWTVEMELSNSLVELTPSVSGTVKALSAQSLSFLPNEMLEQNTEYEVAFALGEIKEVENDLETFNFRVKTVKQDFIVRTEAVAAYDRDYQYVEGSISSSDIMKLEDARKLVEANLDGEMLPLKYPGNTELGKYFTFRIDSIKRPEENTTLKISYNGNPIKIQEKGSYEIQITGKDNFSVTQIEAVSSTSKHILISFSDPIKKGQNLEGLIAVQGAGKISFEIDGNELKVFPQNTVIGSTLIEVFKGIKSTDGYKLKSPFSQQVSFEQIKPQVQLVKSGTILPSSNKSKINFKAVNLNAVDVWLYKIYENNVLQFLQNNNLGSDSNLRQVGRPIARKVIDLKESGKDVSRWNTFSLDLNEIINPDLGAMYRVEFKYKLAYSSYKCAGITSSEAVEQEEIDFDAPLETSNWDGAQNYYFYNNYGYNYNWRDREDPCTPSYFRDKEVSTNILSSDLGLIVKKGNNNSYSFAVSDIVSTAPIGGARIALYDFQQQELASTTSDLEGLAKVNLDRQAYFAKVDHLGQVNYVRLDDGSSLPVSKFDTSGKKLEKGLKGYIYGERGVWRPGDHIYLTFILNDADNKLPSGHPVNLKLTDPNGKLIMTDTQKSGLNNFYQFDLQTDQDAPTGNYNALIEVGGVSFSHRVKVENIKPNRLKVKLGFENEILKSDGATRVELMAQWLHGATAKSLKAEVIVKLLPVKTSFKKYSSYDFDDPGKFLEVQEQEVFNGNLDATGETSFNFNPQVNGEAPGMLKANFLTKVYENGGDFSTNVVSKTFSPFDTYVGLDTPPGDKQRGMLLTDVDHKMDVVTLDESGEPKAVENLDVKVYKVNWRWWWQSQSGSLSRYEARNYRDQVFSTTINTGANGKGQFKFNLKYPDWGRYYVRVYDPASGHSTGKIVYVDWPGWAGKSKKLDPEMASMLVFNADKEIYTVGENASITFPSAAGGRALVTVENGTEVLEAKWVDTQAKQTQFKIKTKPSFVPNVYINITYLQKHEKTANDLPLRMYGVIPIKVENAETHLQPEIKMADVLEPESEVKVTVTEQNDKAMTYTLAVVDDGLLDLTNFKTPDAWDSFYAREALGVKSWDIYDDVIGAYGGRIDAAFAIGGDGSANAAKAKKANRFKPMVVHLGPFYLKTGQSKTHSIKIPKYVGSVRTMVVAGNSASEAYGSVEKTTPVKKPLMMLASLPRKLTPGETVRLPVTVFAMENSIKEVDIKIEESPYFQLLEGDTQELQFSETGDKIAYFKLLVKNRLGIAKINLSASSGREKASYATEIDIINPNPFTTISERLNINGKSSETIQIKPFGVLGSNAATLTFSTMPPLDLGRRLNYLIRYPHGCVEQTTSAAFPQLQLPAFVEMTAQEKNRISQNIKAAINRLNGFQQPNGGFSYWTGYGNANDWGTTYAGHFLIEAEKAGYSIPLSFKSNWIKYQKRAAKQWRANDGDDLRQAYRLYTLALAGAPDLSSMNRLREEIGSGSQSGTKVRNDSKLRLAAAYALIGQKSAAEELVDQSNIDFQPRNYDYRTYGSPQRNRAMALETFVLTDNKSKARDMIEIIAKDLNSNRSYNTQAIAYSLIAAGKYAQENTSDPINVEYVIDGKSETVTTDKSMLHRNIDISNQPVTIEFNNKSSRTVFMNYAVTGKLPVGKELAVQSKLKAVTIYTDRDGKKIDVSRLNQATEIIATTTITNDTGLAVKDLALTRYIPSGWEIVNTRFTDYGDNTTTTGIDYTDIKDDRVHYYFDLNARKSKVIKTVINASYLGKYYLPGIQCEAMYDEEYLVREAGKWVEVVR